MAVKSGVRREKTIEEMISGIDRLITGLEARAVFEDPWVAGEMRRLAGRLRDAETRTIARARRPTPWRAAFTWPAIAFDLGISPLTALKRYKHKIDALEASEL